MTIDRTNSRPIRSNYENFLGRLGADSKPQEPLPRNASRGQKVAYLGKGIASNFLTSLKSSVMWNPVRHQASQWFHNPATATDSTQLADALNSSVAKRAETPTLPEIEENLDESDPIIDPISDIPLPPGLTINDKSRDRTDTSIRTSPSLELHEREYSNVSIASDLSNGGVENLQHIQKIAKEIIDYSNKIGSKDTPSPTSSVTHDDRSQGDNEVQRKTTAFFKKLITSLPEGLQEELKTSLDRMKLHAHWALNIIQHPTQNGALPNAEPPADLNNKIQRNDYWASLTQAQHLNLYFEHCEAFYNRLIQNSEPADARLAPLRDIVLCSLSSMGLLLAYKPLSGNTKFFIFLKRIFLPLGFILHELTGLYLEKLGLDGLFIGIGSSVCATGCGIAITVLVGFIVLFLLHTSIENALHVIREKDIHPDDSAKHKTWLGLRAWLGLCKQQFTTFVKEFFPNIRRKIVGFGEAVKSLFGTQNYNKELMTNEEHQNTTNAVKDFGAQLQGVEWYQNGNLNGAVTSTKPLSDLFRFINQPAEAGGPSPYGEELYRIFALQHQQLNIRSLQQEDEEQEKDAQSVDQKLQKFCTDLAQNITAELPAEVQLDDAQKIMLTRYLTARIYIYSGILCKNSTGFWYNRSQEAAFWMYTASDVAADSFGYLSPNLVRSWSVPNPNLAEHGVTLGGGFAIMSTGLCVYFLIKGAASLYARDRLEKYNDSVKGFVEIHAKEQEKILQKQLDSFNKSHESAKAYRLQGALAVWQNAVEQCG